MNAAPDSYSTWDAAYVLGSLSPAERREYAMYSSRLDTLNRFSA
jgi:hypothetical protein